MPKWFDETILIKYWEDRCHVYSIEGRKILWAKRNPSFGRYPDILENAVRDKDTDRIIPCEIEWTTDNFDRHGHNINVLKDADGFLLVFRKTRGFALPQLEIDHDDFRQWYVTNADSLCAETLQDVNREAVRSKEPRLYLVILSGKDFSSKNLDVAFEKGVWGFPEQSSGRTRGLDKIKQIKQGDIVVFAQSWHFDKAKNPAAKRVKHTEFFGSFERIFGVVVTSKYFSARDEIWKDGKNIYPHRFNFRKRVLFEGIDIEITPKTLGSGFHRIIHRTFYGGAIDVIDASMITKLLSLCTKEVTSSK